MVLHKKVASSACSSPSHKYCISRRPLHRAAEVLSAHFPFCHRSVEKLVLRTWALMQLRYSFISIASSTVLRETFFFKCTYTIIKSAVWCPCLESRDSFFPTVALCPHSFPQKALRLLPAPHPGGFGGGEWWQMTLRTAEFEGISWKLG